jgi:5-methylcytosine-specific restriction endonuclease McrA
VLDIDMDAFRAMRAEGKTYKEIAGAFGCSLGTVRRRLRPVVAEKERERYEQTGKAWRQANPEGGRLASKKWGAAHGDDAERLRRRRSRYAASPEVVRERNRRRYAASGEAGRARRREKYAANPEPVLERIRRHRVENPDIYRNRADVMRQRRRDDLQYRFERQQQRAHRAHVRKGLPYEPVDFEALCVRDSWTCQICDAPVDREIMEYQHPWGMSFDHILPESLGGGWTWENLQLAHRGCNIMRGTLSLAEARAFAREFLKRIAARA